MPSPDNKPLDAKQIEAQLKGKALHIYWFMLSRGDSLGVREIQRSLGFSSPSIAFHHLEKLKGLGIVQQDGYGRYFLTQHVEVGVLQAFTKVGRIMLPRFTFYAVFFTTLLTLYLLLFAAALNLYAVTFALAGTLFSWYETIRAWRRKPF